MYKQEEGKKIKSLLLSLRISNQIFYAFNFFLHGESPFFINLQTVSVSVSILTLTFISIDRWYAICFPLRYKPQPGRAIIWIAIIWTVALLFDLPEFLVLHITEKKLRFEVQLFTQCVAAWSASDEKNFNIIKAIFLYTWVNFLLVRKHFANQFPHDKFLLSPQTFTRVFLADFLSSWWQSHTFKSCGFYGDPTIFQDIVI